MNYYEHHLGDYLRDTAHHPPGRWVEYDLMQGGRLPRFSGVYAVMFDGRLVYVGSSVDIANRFSEHKIRYGYGANIITPWCDLPATSRVTIKVRRSRIHGDWAMWELRLIRRLKPQFNRRSVGRMRRAA